MPIRTIPDAVASEMESIFKPLDGRKRRAPPGGTPLASRPRRPARSRWPLAVAAALVLVPVATATLAIGYGREHPLLPRPAASTRPSPTVRPAPRVAPRSDESSVVAMPASEVPPAAGVPVADTTMDAPVSSPRALADRPAARPLPPVWERVRRTPPPSLDQGPCPPGSSGQDCLFEDMLDADARLRAAYDRADRAGVPVDTLTSINRSWRRARRYAEADPAGTIRRYERLADALDDERDEADR